jgi:exosortase
MSASATSAPNSTTPTEQLPSAVAGGKTTQLLILGILAAVGIALLFAPSFVRLAQIWTDDPDYSHGFLVIPASLFFCGIAWQRLKAQGPITFGGGGIALGVSEILLGVMLHWGAMLFDVLLVDVLALICVIRGTVSLIAGPQVNGAFAFPALFLVFMAPLPPTVHGAIAIFMQQTVAIVSTFVLDLFNVPVFREGYLIHLPGLGAPMEVGEACSGIRSMIAILALAVAIGFLANGSRFYCVTLTALALPIAGLANCIRVILTGVILMTLGREYAEGLAHALEGMVIVALAAAILVAVAWGLGRIEGRMRAPRSSNA